MHKWLFSGLSTVVIFQDIKVVGSSCETKTSQHCAKRSFVQIVEWYVTWHVTWNISVYLFQWSSSCGVRPWFQRVTIRHVKHLKERLRLCWSQISQQLVVLSSTLRRLHTYTYSQRWSTFRAQAPVMRIGTLQWLGWFLFHLIIRETVTVCSTRWDHRKLLWKYIFFRSVLEFT